MKKAEPPDQFRFPTEQAVAFCHDVYHQLGVPVDAIAPLTDSLVDASLRGIDTHGILLTHIYAQRIRSGQIHPDNQLVVVRETATTALADARQGIGQITSVAGMRIAIRKAKEHALGAVSIYNQNHNAAISYYVRMAAEEGLIGLAYGNSTPRVAPYGGRSGLHGTNPVAYAVPTGNGPPMVCDFATATSGAAVRQAVEDGLPSIPEGVALDRSGSPTTNPQDAFDGWLLPKGGPMGYGLGLLADVLVGALADSCCGPDVPPVQDIQSPYGCGSFFLVIDPDAFAGRERFLQRVDFLIDSAHSVPPMDGFDPVRVPGERGELEKERRRIDGIPIRRLTWNKMLSSLENCDVDTSGWKAVWARV